MEKRDMIWSVCEGKGENICKHFDSETRDCGLLENGRRLGEIFEKGRCKPSKMLYQSVYGYCKNFHYMFEEMNVFKPNSDKKSQKSIKSEFISEHAGYITEIVKKRLEETKVVEKKKKHEGEALRKGHNLAELKKYLEIATYHGVWEILREEGLNPKFECGYCIYLTITEMYLCLQREINAKRNPHYRRKRGLNDKACEGGFVPQHAEADPICNNCVYLSKPTCKRKNLAENQDGKEVPNPHYGEKRRPSQKACKEGFKPISTEPIDQNGEDDEEKPETIPSEPPPITIAVDVLTDFAFATSLLRRRIINAKTEKDKEIYERQYKGWLKRRELMYQYDSDEKINEELAKYLRVVPKTIIRDFSEIREFFRKKMSENC